MTANSTTYQSPTLIWRATSRMLKHVSQGTLTLRYNGEVSTFGNSDSKGPHAEATVHDGRVFREILTGGTLAAAETYIEGLWDSPDLTKVVQLFAANVNNDPEQRHWLRSPSKWAHQVAHWLNHNSIRGSRKNIKAHYDLGNDLFECFLDPSMMYSSAIYPHSKASLEEAQSFRLQRICEKLNLSEKNHLLEIGTGWGSMAIYAAQHYGCRVTTTTISDEQYDFTLQRVKDAGLEHKITLLKQDYRLLAGQYDRLVSIEMIEAVGHKYLPGYFKKISDLLTDEGVALIQSITMNDQRYARYKNSVDFIRKYIFPGGHLPSATLISKHIGEQTNMTLSHVEDITEHYARTLNDWHQRFIDNYHTLPSDKYDRQFYRMWRYYLAYCEGGFKERAIGTSQIMFSKPKAKPVWNGQWQS